MLTLSQLQHEIERRALIVGARAYDLPTDEFSDDSARPHIEADSRGYYYVVREKGEERQRTFTIDPDDLLYWVFEHATSSLAIDYARDHQIHGQDSRRVHFARQLELLGRLSQGWRERCEKEINYALRHAPYSDEKHA
jgi:hypothetical protein